VAPVSVERDPETGTGTGAQEHVSATAEHTTSYLAAGPGGAAARSTSSEAVASDGTSSIHGCGPAAALLRR
jgi:hypothetical protein